MNPWPGPCVLSAPEVLTMLPSRLLVLWNLVGYVMTVPQLLEFRCVVLDSHSVTLLEDLPAVVSSLSCCLLCSLQLSLEVTKDIQQRILLFWQKPLVLLPMKSF